MQIFEITQPQQVDEVLGAAKAVGREAQAVARSLASTAPATFASGLASGLTRAAVQKFAASQGIDAGLGPTRIAGGADPQATAMQVNAGLVKSLADKSQKTWMQLVQNMLAQARTPVTSIAQVDRNELEKQLQMLVNQLAGFDTTKLPTSTPVAREVKTRLPQAMDQVVKATQAAKMDPNEMFQSWQELATYIAQAQNINQFSKQSKRGNTKLATVTFAPDGTALYDGQPFNASNARHVATQNQLQSTTK